jgi:hypothetical protein
VGSQLKTFLSSVLNEYDVPQPWHLNENSLPITFDDGKVKVVTFLYPHFGHFVPN